jgi:LAO/AO transport system kinase
MSGTDSGHARPGGLPARVQLARLLSRVERQDHDDDLARLPEPGPGDWIIGVTGPPGVGKSTLVSALVTAYRAAGTRVAVLAVDPSSPYSGGAVLGDRLRMTEHLGDDGVFIRSLASRGQLGGLAAAVPLAIRGCLGYGYPRVIVETVGVGQSEVEVARSTDTTVLATAPGLGDSVQASKAGVLEVADVLVVNKSDQEGAKDVERDLVAMVRLGATPAGGWRVPVVLTQGTSGSGVDELMRAIEQHRDFTIGNGQVEARRAGRRLAEWRARCERLAHDRLADAYASAAGRDLAAQVADGRSTAAAAADALTSRLFRPGEHSDGTGRS